MAQRNQILDFLIVGSNTVSETEHSATQNILKKNLHY